jgi:hypothetical protein
MLLIHFIIIVFNEVYNLYNNSRFDFELQFNRGFRPQYIIIYVQQLNDHVTYQPQHKIYMFCISNLVGSHIDLPLLAYYLLLDTRDERQF